MGELAFVAVGTKPFFCEIPAEGTLGFGGSVFGREGVGRGEGWVVVGGVFEVVVVGGDVGTGVGEGLVRARGSQ